MQHFVVDFCRLFRKEFFGEKERKSAYATTIKSETFFLGACSLALSMTPSGTGALVVLLLHFFVVFFFFAISEHKSIHSRPPYIPPLLHFAPRNEGRDVNEKQGQTVEPFLSFSLSPFASVSVSIIILSLVCMGVQDLVQ